MAELLEITLEFTWILSLLNNRRTSTNKKPKSDRKNWRKLRRISPRNKRMPLKWRNKRFRLQNKLLNLTLHLLLGHNNQKKQHHNFDLNTLNHHYFSFEVNYFLNSQIISNIKKYKIGIIEFRWVYAIVSIFEHSATSVWEFESFDTHKVIS